ncbi:nucleotidyltransferase family protein [Kitasatospora phosalacinea]|uniref:nucleotidyltransferase domain-containing protein n=1 Tax=Kitasatospora phosalacinea TaxID=2065 RepID=UPI0035E33637
MTDLAHDHRLHSDTLLRLADLSLTEQGARRLHATLNDRRHELDWAWLVHQGARHQVLPLIGFNVKRFRLHQPVDGDADLVPYRWLLTSALEGNRQRNEALRAEFARILTAARDLGVAHAVRKGPLLCEHLYPDPATRRMSDLDLLVSKEGAEALGEALGELGYVQGRLSGDGTSVEAFSRSTRKFWSMYVSNALPFVKPASHPYVEVFALDLCLDLTPAAGDGAAERTAEFLSRTVPVVTCGVPSRRLAPEDELLDLCVHLHKEADARHYIALGQDLALSKFIDVACTVARSTPDVQERFAARVAELGVRESVFFALYYARELYPALVPVELVDSVRPSDSRVLDEYGYLDGRPSAWRSTFRERLFSSGRSSEANDARSLPLT